MGWSCSGWPVEEVALSEIVMVEVPEGVTTGGGVVVLPPPQPARNNGMKKMATAERAPQSVRRLLRTAGGNARSFLLKRENNRERSASKIGVGTGTRETGGMLSGAEGGNWAGPLVVTVTLKGAGLPFVTATLEGAWQTAPRGAPLQVSPIVPVKPDPGMS